MPTQAPVLDVLLLHKVNKLIAKNALSRQLEIVEKMYDFSFEI